MTTIERYVPTEDSLAADAPGYAADGPICWKCRGDGKAQCKDKLKKAQMNTQPSAACPVCRGTGRLAVRKVAVVPGKITRGRKGFVDIGSPDPAGYSVETWGNKLKHATFQCEDVIITGTEDDNPVGVGRPAWIPREGEELCNLTGKWRILQRVGSHRWTTDDLVTAAVAARELLQMADGRRGIQYCDLGTGNASVLQMVLHKAATVSNVKIDQAVGVEARSEAVGLARRSLQCNVGPDSRVSIVNADFRSFGQDSSNAAKFDLITGTPPYFRVDFSVNPNGRSVEAATIRQGGMPTSVQSAPARCEFRGGMEAYCQAAQQLLKDNSSIFCICENYQNHQRALQAFREHNLALRKNFQVEGKIGRGILFCVYVLQKEMKAKPEKGSPVTVELAVRDDNGEWTDEYAKEILEFMSIPR